MPWAGRRAYGRGRPARDRQDLCTPPWLSTTPGRARRPRGSKEQLSPARGRNARPSVFPPRPEALCAPNSRESGSAALYVAPLAVLDCEEGRARGGAAGPGPGDHVDAQRRAIQRSRGCGRCRCRGRTGGAALESLNRSPRRGRRRGDEVAGEVKISSRAPPEVGDDGSGTVPEVAVCSTWRFSTLHGSGRCGCCCALRRWGRAR